MSRPGTIQQVPTTAADRAVAATLVDHEIGFYTDDDELREALSDHGRLAVAPPEAAAIVHATGVPSWDTGDLARGSLVEPSEGATVIYRLDAMAPAADVDSVVGADGDADADTGANTDTDVGVDTDVGADVTPIDEGGLTTVTLSGPGIPDARSVRLGLPAAQLEALAAAQSPYPRGIDAVFTAADRLVAIPRSVSMEVA